MEVIWLNPRKGGPKNAGCISERIVTIGSTKAYKGSNPCYLTLYPKFMAEMRFLCGDRFNVGYSPDGASIMIKRAANGGYLLGARSLGRNEREKAVGKIVTSQIKFTMPAPIETRSVGRHEITVLEDGTILIPKRPA